MQGKKVLLLSSITILVFLISSGIFVGGVFAWIRVLQPWCRINSGPINECVIDNNITYNHQIYDIYTTKIGYGRGYIRCQVKNCDESCNISLLIRGEYFCFSQNNYYQIIPQPSDNIMIVILLACAALITGCFYCTHFGLYCMIWNKNENQSKEDKEPVEDVQEDKISYSSSDTDLELDTTSSSDDLALHLD